MKQLQPTPETMHMFASKKCNKCYGRGFVTISSNNITANNYYCSCVSKNMRKFNRETLRDDGDKGI